MIYEKRPKALGKRRINFSYQSVQQNQIWPIHQGNPAIIDLAHVIGRTPGSVAYKLVNFASLDPRLKQKGMINASKLDREVWQEYMEHWDDVYIESENLLAAKK